MSTRTLNLDDRLYDYLLSHSLREHAIGNANSVIRNLKHDVERVLPHAPDTPFDPEGPECQWRDPPKPPV
ncbi:MAG: hypothetical protein WD944_05450 [Steroidobacteraceae bacterium]